MIAVKNFIFMDKFVDDILKCKYELMDYKIRKFISNVYIKNSYNLNTSKKYHSTTIKTMNLIKEHSDLKKICIK